MSLPSYMVLMNPGHSRVYFENTKGIAALELAAVMRQAEAAVFDVRHITSAGIDYLAFDTQNPLYEGDLLKVARLSSFYALFEVRGEFLLPVEAAPKFLMPESLNSILKYSGKTNEQFTRLMINLALSGCKKTDKPILLDPLAGKGTTLFEGAILGFDVIGIEKSDLSAHECETFFVKFLERGKYKHTAKRERRTEDGKKIAQVSTVEYALTREEFKAGNLNKFTVIAGDTACAGVLIKRESVDILVSDLPYGVQHGSKAGEGKEQTLSRGAADLVHKALPSWLRVLKKGGAMALAFNEFTTKREKLAEVLMERGLLVLEEGYTGLAHRVDQAINRDIIIAIKK